MATESKTAAPQAYGSAPQLEASLDLPLGLTSLLAPEPDVHVLAARIEMGTGPSDGSSQPVSVPMVSMDLQVDLPLNDLLETAMASTVMGLQAFEEDLVNEVKAAKVLRGRDPIDPMLVPAPPALAAK